MNKVLAFLLCLVFLVPSISYAINAQLNYSPGNIWATTVSDSTTALGMTYLRGSVQPQTDVTGQTFFSTGFQIEAINGTLASDGKTISGTLNPMDFWYGYSSSSTMNFWQGSVLGPMSRYMTLPQNGFYVSPTFTTQGSCVFTFETIQ